MADRPAADHGPGDHRSTPLGDLTSPQVAQRPVVVLVPLGSLEQHGPHLPLDTDTRIALELCERAARAWATTPLAVDLPLYVGPTIGYGASGEHAGFAGTLSIGTDVLAATLVELTRSAGPDVAALVVINGHGGNHDAVQRATRLATAEGRRLLAWSPPLPPGGDHHGGWVETSVMLAIHPELVRLELAEAGNVKPIEDLTAALRSQGLAAVTTNGVLGDPRNATAERGEQVLARWQSQLSSSLGQWFPATTQRP